MAYMLVFRMILETNYCMMDYIDLDYIDHGYELYIVATGCHGVHIDYDMITAQG